MLLVTRFAEFCSISVFISFCCVFILLSRAAAASMSTIITITVQKNDGQQQQQVQQQGVAPKSCCICGWYLAWYNTNPTCGNCLRAGLAAAAERKAAWDASVAAAAAAAVAPVEGTEPAAADGPELGPEIAHGPGEAAAAGPELGAAMAGL